MVCAGILIAASIAVKIREVDGCGQHVDLLIDDGLRAPCRAPEQSLIRISDGPRGCLSEQTTSFIVPTAVETSWGLHGARDPEQRAQTRVRRGSSARCVQVIPAASVIKGCRLKPCGPDHEETCRRPFSHP